MSYWWIQTVNNMISRHTQGELYYLALLWMVLEAQGEDPYDYV
jgi:hypothetical protein